MRLPWLRPKRTRAPTETHTRSDRNAMTIWPFSHDFVALADLTLQFPFAFTKLLYYKFIPSLNIFTIQE